MAASTLLQPLRPYRDPNVCTYYEVSTPIPEERTDPVPIGKICSHLEGVVVNSEGKTVTKGAEGELCIRGAGVTQGYWNLPEQSRNSFIISGSRPGLLPDPPVLLREAADGNFQYLGRKDRMD